MLTRKQTRVSRTGVGSTGWIGLNDAGFGPFGASFAVSVTGTVAYTLEHTLEDVEGGVTVDATKVFPHPEVTNQAVSRGGAYAFPVAAIRVTVLSGTGSVELVVLQ